MKPHKRVSGPLAGRSQAAPVAGISRRPADGASRNSRVAAYSVLGICQSALLKHFDSFARSLERPAGRVLGLEAANTFFCAPLHSSSFNYGSATAAQHRYAHAAPELRPFSSKTDG
eukprot:356133-Chlamydomonas_euryale.AAC.3